MTEKDSIHICEHPLLSEGTNQPQTMQKLSFVLSVAMVHIAACMLSAQPVAHTLPSLPYAYNALEPYIDAQTMEIHHGRHHNAYVANLNKALAGTRFAPMAMNDLLLRAGVAGEAIRNNGGGHYNHTLFWNILGTDQPFDPQSEVGMAIVQTFSSYDSLRTLMNNAGATRFGSGWAWLYLTPEKKLAVCSTSNQDNPIMDINPHRGIPLLGIDVWEHAYYLKYQNKRGDYLGAVWNVINWKAVNDNYKAALADPFLKVIEKDAWKELKAFHSVMSTTFHPAEKGDFAPIRSRSGEMLAMARKLQAAPIPASFATPAMQQEIARLVSGADALDKLVRKNKPNEVVMQSLNRLHDVFHNIQGLCND